MANRIAIGSGIAFAIAAVLVVLLAVGVWTGNEGWRQHEPPDERSGQPIPGDAMPRSEPTPPAQQN